MDRVRDAPLYARVLFGLVAGLAIGLLVFALLSPARKEAIKMAAGCWPPALEGQRPDENFEKTPDPHKIWELPPGQPKYEPGAGDSDAIVIKGPRVVTLKQDSLGGRLFYDLRVNFALQFAEGSRLAGWLLRAQPDGRGYLFVLRRGPDGTLSLHGLIYDGYSALTEENISKLKPIDSPRPSPINWTHLKIVT